MLIHSNNITMKRRRKLKTRKRYAVDSDSDSDDSDDDAEIQVFKNHIYFWCGVTKKTSLELTLKLNKLYNEMSSYSLNGDDCVPIYIHINSLGGDVDAALGVIDTMESLKQSGAHLITIIEGKVASAATLISVAGSERRIRPNAFMRIHNFSTTLWGKKNELDDEHGNLEKLEDILISFYKKHTNMNKQQLKKIMSREIDLVVHECCEKGLVDSIQN